LFRLRLTPVEEPQRLSSYLKREWKILAVVTVTGILFNGSMSYAAVLQGRLIDTVVNRMALSAVLRQTLIFVGAIAAIQLMRVLKRYFVRLFANRTGAAMRMMLYNSVLSKDMDTFGGISAGDLMNRLVGDVDICVEGMRKVITEIFDTGVLMLSYLTAMLLYDVKTTIVSCLFIPAAMLLADKLKFVVERSTKLARAQSGAVSSLTLSHAENALLYRVNSADSRKRAEYDKELEKLEELSVRADVLENSMQPIYSAFALLGIVGILYFGGKNVATAVWSIGDFTAYLTIFLALSTKAGKAGKLFNTYQKAAVSWNRIKPGFRAWEPPAEKSGAEEPDASLSCVDLSFTYPDSESEAFEALSFEAISGELIGVTGAVASGKTALGLALTGLYPYGGEILLCGEELGRTSLAERSRRVAYMGHDPQLLSDTLYENITLGDGGDISEILRAVCFEEELEAMPDGVNTLLGSGGIRLSGGQRARIALARALYRRSKLVILDDPFSAVDMETEGRIIQNLRRGFSDRIIVLISHRLAVFPQTDKVLFFENGCAHSSTHAELLSECGAYKKLWDAQKGGAANEE